MLLKKRCRKSPLVALFSAALLWGVALSGSAATQELTAVFAPDSQNPLNNKFTNTTPQSGVCPGHMPAVCKQLGIFSIRTWDINFRSIGPMLFDPSGPGDPRKGVMFKMPSEWRRLEVVSETGQPEIVEVRIAGIGNRVNVTPPATWASWSPRTWQYAPAPCQSTGFLTGTAQYVLWFWLVPQGAGACNLVHTTNVPALDYVNFEYAYELRTPNPLTMSTGTYRGTTVYSLGPNQDFDFGDIMIPNDSTLVFNFTLSVVHTLTVDIPPGGNNVELVPQGGWQAWLNQGRKPVRLFRDQTFNLYASSRFKMQLDCEYVEAENTCRVLDRVSGESVPVNVSVTLPYGITDPAGRPVNRQPLRRDGVGTELFQPTFYVDRKPSTLHFEIERDEVEKMLKVGESRTYSGNITVIWDSEV